MNLPHTPPNNRRIGFHYIPDTLHYRESDLNAWLPELRSLSADWLVLKAPGSRAIPEFFIGGLVKAGVEPVLEFGLPLATPPEPDEFKTLLDTYAKWGVHHVIFFSQPNNRSAWSTATWLQEDLVERFLDRYLPLANLALHAGLTPVFPPLEPGGNYWDTAFLRAALLSLQRRKQNDLLDHLLLSAYAWTHRHPLSWGAGGPQRWPGSRPYHTPEKEQDQCGFRIFDWYETVTQSVLTETRPILLLQAGVPGNPTRLSTAVLDRSEHAKTALSIVQQLLGQTAPDPSEPGKNLDALPQEVIGCCFWLLAAPKDSAQLRWAWFQPEGQALPVVGALRQLISNLEIPEPTTVAAKGLEGDLQHPINHYLLLPKYEWGIADWHLDIIRPYIKKHQATVGFSLTEARFASKVTVIGGPQSFSEDELDSLRSAGCEVDRIFGDGTSVATQLAER